MKYVWKEGEWRDGEGNVLDTPDRVCAPRIHSDYPAYYSHASGKMVEGRRARRDDLARTGCREVDPSEGPKTCRSEKWARKLGLEHDPNAGRPKHWADWQTSTRVDDKPSP